MTAVADNDEVKIRDGANVALGSTTDAALTTNTPGTLIGFARGLVTLARSAIDATTQRVNAHVFNQLLSPEITLPAAAATAELELLAQPHRDQVAGEARDFVWVGSRYIQFQNFNSLPHEGNQYLALGGTVAATAQALVDRINAPNQGLWGETLATAVISPTNPNLILLTAKIQGAAGNKIDLYANYYYPTFVPFRLSPRFRLVPFAGGADIAIVPATYEKVHVATGLDASATAVTAVLGKPTDQPKFNGVVGSSGTIIAFLRGISDYLENKTVRVAVQSSVPLYLAGENTSVVNDTIYIEPDTSEAEIYSVDMSQTRGEKFNLYLYNFSTRAMSATIASMLGFQSNEVTLNTQTIVLPPSQLVTVELPSPVGTFLYIDTKTQDDLPHTTTDLLGVDFSIVRVR